MLESRAGSGRLAGQPEMMDLLKRLRDFLELIKFEHTIFALPFAYLGMLLAAEAGRPGHSSYGSPSPWPPLARWG